jgi:hypothetical protein
MGLSNSGYNTHNIDITYIYISGWWLVSTPLKNDGVSNSWDDAIPNIWKNKKCSKPPVSGHWNLTWSCLPYSKGYVIVCPKIWLYMVQYLRFRYLKWP